MFGCSFNKAAWLAPVPWICRNFACVANKFQAFVFKCFDKCCNYQLAFAFILLYAFQDLFRRSQLLVELVAGCCHSCHYHSFLVWLTPSRFCSFATTPIIFTSSNFCNDLTKCLSLMTKCKYIKHKISKTLQKCIASSNIEAFRIQKISYRTPPQIDKGSNS